MNFDTLANKLNVTANLVKSMLLYSNKPQIQEGNAKHLLDMLSTLTNDPLNILLHLRNGNFVINGANHYFETNASGQELWNVNLLFPELLLVSLNCKSSYHGGWEIDESTITVNALTQVESSPSTKDVYQDSLQQYAHDFACLILGNELCDTPDDVEMDCIDLTDINILEEWSRTTTSDNKYLVQTIVTSGEDSAIETTLIAGARDEEDAANQAILCLDRSCKLIWSPDENYVETSWGYPRYETNSIRSVGGLEYVTLEKHFHPQRCHQELFANASYIPRLALNLCLKDSEFQGEFGFASLVLSNPVLGNYVLDVNETTVELDGVFNHFTSTFEDDVIEIETAHEEYNAINHSLVDPNIDLIALLNHSKTVIDLNLIGNFELQAISEGERVVLVDRTTDVNYPVRLHTNL
ncbi:hypothetical protein M3899_003163 [Vibrio parahaemolyticus]|nr:hypothetical protein [Vibrio parahaemolyticus]